MAECVICNGTSGESGLCDRHKYDEQPAADVSERTRVLTDPEEFPHFSICKFEDGTPEQRCTCKRKDILATIEHAKAAGQRAMLERLRPWIRHLPHCEFPDTTVGQMKTTGKPNPCTCGLHEAMKIPD